MAGDHCQKIPNHMIFFHILPRLPVESLQRCKSVCQQWHSFLKTRYFARMMCNRRLTNGSTVDQLCHKLLFLPCYDDYERGFRIMDCEAADDDGLISQCYPFPFKYSSLDKISIQTSLHGLVCICGQFEKGLYGSKTELVIWNPMTGEYKKLGKTNPHMKSYFSQVRALGLYYSGMSDDDKEYKLLTVSYNCSVHIYSLKSDSWRKLDSRDNYETLLELRLFGREMIRSSTWFNGNLYFLTEWPAVLKFDTKMEKFTIIPTPPSLNDLDVKRLMMDVHKGVIHLGVNYETSEHQNSKKAHIQLWKMIEDENWEKVGAPFRIDISMYPFSWLRNKTWLMVESLQRGYYEAEKKLHKVDYSKSYTKGKNYVTNGKSAPIISIYDSHAKVNYIESFLSIDGSI